MLDIKLKNLSNYRAPEVTKYENNKTVMDDASKDFIEKYLNELYLSIARLDEDSKKELTDELLTKLKQFQSDLKNLKLDGLTTTNEEYIRQNFIGYLSDIEKRINYKLEAINYDEKLTNIARSFEGVITNTGEIAVKKRILTKGDYYEVPNSR